MFLSILIITTSVLLIGYGLLALYVRRGFFKLEQAEPAGNEPIISVIVPAHNEENSLPHLMDCLSRQDYPVQKIEFLFVNDRSTDLTNELMCGFVSQHENAKAIQLDETPAGISPKKHAIATAIESASGEIILTTDADASPKPGWISAMMKCYDENTGMVLGYAPYRTDGPYRSLFHQILALDYFAMGAMTAATAGRGHPLTCNGANLSYRKSVFEEVDGFGETASLMSGDDDLLMHRIRSNTPWKIGYCIDPESVVFNKPPRTIWKFIRQRIRFASKHHAYPGKMKAGLLSVYFLHLFMLALLIGSVFSLSHLPFFLVLLGAKVLFELIFIIPGKRLLEKRNLLILYPLTVIPYLFYVVLFPILGLTLKSRW
jgi:cellulose synthase/poly-beta-1,6-N-acetylglucosamine synthase-like glycosyltransferase